MTIKCLKQSQIYLSLLKKLMTKNIALLFFLGGHMIQFKTLPITIINTSLNITMAPQGVKDIPAQWAKIRQGLDIFGISSKCVCLSNGKV